MNRENTVQLESRARLIVRARNLTKIYGPTRANDDVSLTVACGDVIGLVGGNGAGKSTLMRMLCGTTPPDSGTIDFGDEAQTDSAYDAGIAQQRGIRIVHQELSLCSNLSVAENFYLEAPEDAKAQPGWRAVYRERARVALDAVFPGHGIDVDAEAGQLPIGERQMVEIARTVAAPGVKLVILDEPTSSLGLERSRQLRAYIHAKAVEGLAFIFISHKLHEIVDVATRVVLMRNGKLEWAGLATDASVPVLVRLMGGEAAAALREASDEHQGATGEVCLRLTGGAAGGDTIELRRGQIVGLAGLEGSGQKEVLHQIFAAARRSATKVERIGAVSFVSGDRQREGVFPLWTVLSNISIGSLASGSPFRLVTNAGEREIASNAAERLRLDSTRLASGILDLSGGNQQKALMARALVSEAPIILLDDPTRGVDIAAKRDFYKLVAEVARSGRLVLWHSTEDLEFLECDQVLVFAGGRVARELNGAEISEQAIVDASFVQPSNAAATSPSARGGSVFGRRVVQLAPFISLAIVFAAMMLANPATGSVFGLDLLLGPALPLVLVALGQMFVVGGSEIDLGAGAFAGLVNVLSATLLFDSPALGFASLTAAMATYSALGWLIQARRIPAIVITLGASFIWMGVGHTLQPTPGGASPEWLSALFTWSVPGVPTSLVLIVVAGFAAWVLDRSPLGVSLRAFGNNPVAMARAGWSAPRYAALRYVVAAAFIVTAGLALTAINTASDVNSGSSYTLLGVAGVVIGGCSLMGGRISPAGVVAGSVTLALIGALLGTLNVSSDFNAAVQGALLVVILALRALVTRNGSEE
ncbi:ATP-binding cassette domain-containing protein [Caballeronia novacaledonica]|uniref:ATP-binding cassette domain-containing protein n=1 Tax=Caballeronia novacaledonica TaxID=1544861 RepID=A0AA37IHK5_9BURK|nr:ATP-binding cassette domain-containing protein [Caballeronia novacaledonica]GJH29404.1 ATP-binding cassette domain-containing protein [Caballeronia novacaledonica]